MNTDIKTASPVGWNTLFIKIMLLCCGGLLIVFSVVLFMFSGSVGLWLMQTFPLLLTLPGLLKHNSRAQQWLCFLVLFYFTDGVLMMFAPEKIILGSMEVLFSVIIFMLAIISIRSRSSRNEKS